AEELVADEASVLTFSGHPDRALAVLDRIAGADRRTRVVRAIAGAVALAAAGRAAEAPALARAGPAHHLAPRDAPALPRAAPALPRRAVAVATRASPRAGGGRLRGAGEVARAGAEIAAPQGVPIAQIWFSVTRGRVAILRGGVAPARRFYAEAVGLAQSNR